MVGVGGGVPRGNPDIRLGDIVVSKPTDTSSGVIQYDYGKTLQRGRFYRTGSLNKPPSLLLKVIAQMESDYMLGKASLSNIMASCLQKEEVRKQFPRPSKDQLFQPTYDHVHNRPDCATCDPSQLVDRPERVAEEPHIHYGLVASGNQVMKDGRARDLIAQELDILCCEMEAAGLMDEIPSLVIRGICDYCDSHKHKEWQPYAAFVAAAYAKAVLMEVPFREGADNLGKSISEKRHWTVPFRKNPGFVGREGEIAKVDELFGKMNGPFKVALCGLGGVGKTQIALELAYRLRERDPTCSVFWIPCTSNASVEQAFVGIAQTIGLQEAKPSNAKERVKAYLSLVSDQKWLLIFDNADNMDMWVGDSAGATELANFLLPSEQGHILFTTRNRKLAVRLTSPFVVDISEPDAETGVKILEEALQKKELLENEDETITFLEQLTFLPLAISQAAAYINSNDIKLFDYITLLKEQESDVIELLSEDFGDDGRYQDIQNPVATTWLISFQQVQQLNPLAADYLSFMACINPRDIPQSLLPEATSIKKKIDAIGLLKAFSFVSEQAQDNALSLHRLVHLSTRNWLRKQQHFDRQIQRTADRFSKVFPNNDHANQELWRSYLPHALSLITENDFQKEQKKHIRLMQNIGICLQADGKYNKAADILENIISLQRKGNGDPDISTLFSISNLAATYGCQGRWKEAEELHQQVLEIRKRVLGPEHPETLTSMAYLAYTFGERGQWKEAEELGMHVLQIRKRVLGPENPETLTSMANLAYKYGEQGRGQEAQELEKQVLEISKQVLGPDHPETLTSMANLAARHSKQGQWKEAEELGVHVLEDRKRVLGPVHPDTLLSMANLASIYQSRVQWQKAEELQLQLINARKQVLGLEHPSTLTSIANLASTYWNLGRWDEAGKLLVQVMQAWIQVLGSEHPNTLTSMHNLASIWHSQQRIHEAIDLMDECVKLRNRVLGSSHPRTITSTRSLRDWKERVNSLREEQSQYLIQAESDQPSGKTKGAFSTGLVLTRPTGGNSEGVVLVWSREPSTTPLKAFCQTHPFLKAFRNNSLVLGGQDLQEID
jgi:nucleoside phosphorylase/tetratricopeptide (TPR) repeat protein